MVAKTDCFTPDVILSSKRVKEFLKGDKEILEIGKSAYASRSAPQIFCNRWEITWIRVKSFFDDILEVFWEALSSIFTCFGCTNLSKRCFLLSIHQHYDHDKVALYDRYGKDFLVPAINIHRLDTSDFYLQDPVSISHINDNGIKKASINNTNTVKFNHFKGVCRGMSDWFIYLYLKTKHLYKDPEEHLKAVARIFDKGATRESALLQSFCRGMENFLGLNVEYAVLGLEYVKVERPSGIEGIQKLPPGADGIEGIQKLPPGAYNILSKFHSWVYIKIDDHLGYIWDPNCGLIRRDDSGQGQAAKIAEFLRKYEGPYSFDRARDPLTMAGSNQYGMPLSAAG